MPTRQRLINAIDRFDNGTSLFCTLFIYKPDGDLDIIFDIFPDCTSKNNVCSMKTAALPADVDTNRVRALAVPTLQQINFWRCIFKGLLWAAFRFVLFERRVTTPVTACRGFRPVQVLPLIRSLHENAWIPLCGALITALCLSLLEACLVETPWKKEWPFFLLRTHDRLHNPKKNQYSNKSNYAFIIYKSPTVWLVKS